MFALGVLFQPPVVCHVFPARARGVPIKSARVFLLKEQAKQIGYVGKSAYNLNVALMSTVAAFQLGIAHLVIDYNVL